MILMNRIAVPDVPLVVSFLDFHIVLQVQSFERVKLLLMHLLQLKLSGRPGTFLLPGADYSAGIRFKTTAAILAVVQRLLSYNTCWGFQLLPSDSFWLLHLPGNIELAGRKSRRRILLTRATPFRRCYKPNLTFDTCRGIFESFTASDRGFQ